MFLAAAELAKPILFVEFRFLWIFALIFSVHWALRSNTARKVWLLVASHAFYGCFFIGDPFVVRSVTAKTAGTTVLTFGTNPGVDFVVSDFERSVSPPPRWSDPGRPRPRS